MGANTTSRGKWLNAVIGAAALLVAQGAPVAGAVTLWSDERTLGGSGLFFGPGSWPNVETLFPVIIRNMGFVSDVDFVTPFKNNGEQEPNIIGEKEFGPIDGVISDGSPINENVDIRTFVIAGTQVLPVVVRAGGKFGGSQVSVTMQEGEVVMVMDFTIDLGIGPRGIIKLPFYGTTGTLTVPLSLQTQSGGKGVDQAGPLASGTTMVGRLGDFNGDGYIDGTLIAAGVLPLTSPIYPGQPYALVRNFETDIAVDGSMIGQHTLVTEKSTR